MANIINVGGLKPKPDSLWLGLPNIHSRFDWAGVTQQLCSLMLSSSSWVQIPLPDQN
jgi:hypothetical protein